MALAPIGGVGFSARGFAPIRIGGLLAEAYEIEHMDRPEPIVRAEGCKSLLGRVDMAGHAVLLSQKDAVEKRNGLFSLCPRGTDRQVTAWLISPKIADGFRCGAVACYRAATNALLRQSKRRSCSMGCV